MKTRPPFCERLQTQQGLALVDPQDRSVQTRRVHTHNEDLLPLVGPGYEGVATSRGLLGSMKALSALFKQSPRVLQVRSDVPPQ